MAGHVLRWQNGRAGISQPALLAVAGALLLVCLSIFYFCNRPTPTPKENRKPYEALGEITAEETAKLIGRKGRVIVVIFNPEKGLPGFTEQNLTLASFQRSARAHGLDIVATEKVDFGPHILNGQPAISAEQFSEWMQRESTDAVVSFVGAPVLTSEQANLLRQRRVKFVSLGHFCQPTPETLAAHVVDLAILPATGLVQPGSLSGSTRECFVRYYRLVTPDTSR